MFNPASYRNRLENGNMNTDTRALGIDIGSTTTKLVFIENEKIIYEKYRRHHSKVQETTLEMLREARPYLAAAPFAAAISGSAGMGIAERADIEFVQEVYATGEVVRELSPETGLVIELGGEDAKAIFFNGGIDERMNGSCAGGTGAFIDQMAVLLNMSVTEMDRESLKSTKLYPIASRCGVFAKTDIQALLNQGAVKADVAASIYQAVVNQTITGLVRGRRIEGSVMFLGGPLHYCRGLRKRFVETLGLTSETAQFPDYDRFSVALGAAMYIRDGKTVSCDQLIRSLEDGAKKKTETKESLPVLFASKEDYERFDERHRKAKVQSGDIAAYTGRAWLGIDCGSTTTKLTLIAEDKSILYSYYSSNCGDPVSLVAEQLNRIYTLCTPRIQIAGSSVTGYGEKLIKNAFHIDEGIVETVAHYTAARYFEPNVDFILDIVGQDIKCFWIKDGGIDKIMLNEACSSGCGSFIETFAKSMGYDAEEFAHIGLLSAAPVNLGSRCTVFMNSSVKQSQKDGASVSDISAGLSVSVVKNAIYKVIRAVSPEELGSCVVVQGGTFMNDAVLRAFEMELGHDVVRPDIAGLMGAYGAALHVMDTKESTLMSAAELKNFTHVATSSKCRSCPNNCHLTINRFSDGGRYISGNQCSRALKIKDSTELPNIYEWKRNYFSGLKSVRGARGRIGLPMALSMYEFAPLWHALFTELGYEVHFSDFSTRRTYDKGQYTIPSDTICYPAKLMHGHIQELIDKGLETIFYPSLTYNVDEGAGDNHYNCPVVAYYGEVLNANISGLRDRRFLYPYLSLESPKTLGKTLYRCLKEFDASVSRKEVMKAARTGFEAYETYKQALKDEARRSLDYAGREGRNVMVLAGRPYHADPEVNHGIDKLANSLGYVVLSEDSVCDMVPAEQVKVLDQWTFHTRMYRAARFAVKHNNTQLVQLVSFGCGIDAITGDEVMSILESEHKKYTQIKIDEITNSGAVQVRLRSLMAATEEGNNAG